MGKNVIDNQNANKADNIRRNTLGTETQRGDGTVKSRCDRTGNSLALKHRYTERILHQHDAHVCHT